MHPHVSAGNIPLFHERQGTKARSSSHAGKEKSRTPLQKLLQRHRRKLKIERKVATVLLEWQQEDDDGDKKKNKNEYLQTAVSMNGTLQRQK